MLNRMRVSKVLRTQAHPRYQVEIEGLVSDDTSAFGAGVGE